MSEKDARLRYRHQTLRHELGAVVGHERVSSDAEELREQAMDWSWYARYLEYRDIPVPTADVVVRPDTAEQVAEVLRIAYDHGVAVVPRGGGSGTQGGTLAPFGGIALDLRGLDRITEIDRTSLTVTAESGTDGAELEAAVNAEGLTLAHYPGSAHRGATLGGYLAARGSGVVSTKYGKAEDMVLSVESALPPGRLVRTPATPSHAAGPGLLPLLVGAEGTLGVLTSATMRLDPLPEARAFLSFGFADVDAGLRAGREIMAARWRPAAMRLYDPAGTEYLRRSVEIGTDGVVLLVVCDGAQRLVDLETEEITALVRNAGGTELGEQAARTWWDGRENPHAESNAPKPPLLYGTADACCTFDRIGELYAAKKKVVEDEFGARYTAHFSHWYPWGAMIYDRFYVDSPPADPDEALALHDRIWDRLAATNLECGAVLNDHHGVGAKLGRFMRAQYGTGFDVLCDIKRSIDPRGLMNPGKLGFPVPENLR
ncbi:FAD-binding oxidoreductase [Sciscionella sediminilitoris]|uniref:FAD-binding oxidoreductase n=1 Tax=Sciscionella sediminilitoris TaxID=1445613 RepID=UPI000691115A|nr:FAD-binding oxidoreductase [Sciscionella sp. SE31]